MITTLLNWSGGIDSTYCLINWLQTHTKRETILVHHTKIKNHQKRDEAETLAIKNIRTQLSQDGHTNYRYLETTFDYGTLDRRTPIMDHEIIALWTGIILRNPNYWTVKTIITPFMEDLDGRTDRIELWRNIYHTIRPLSWQRNPPPPAQMTFPIMHMSKKQLLDGLPEEYRKLIWWCRRPRKKPKGFYICGQCPTCVSVLSQYPEARQWYPENS